MVKYLYFMITKTKILPNQNFECTEGDSPFRVYIGSRLLTIVPNRDKFEVRLSGVESDGGEGDLAQVMVSDY